MGDRGDTGRATARRGMVALAVSASLAFTMAACGDDDDDTTAAGSSQTTATTATTAAAQQATTSTTTAAAGATVATAANAALGTTILVDAAGKTLYVFDRDTSPTSTCVGAPCALTWPPLVLPAGTTAPVAGTGVTGLTVAARPDDATKMQVVFNGKPLYTFAADTAPGETKGDGVGGNWHVAKPA